MGDKTKIEWTDATWNPVTGCSKVSAGCKFCYAERDFHRPYPGREFTDVRIHPDRLEQPLHWKKPRKIFVNSMSDLFHEDIPIEFLQNVWRVMVRAHRERGHIFQVLTKRPHRMNESLGPKGFGWYAKEGLVPKPEPGIWLGVSVEDQKTVDERIPLLLQTPAAVRFVSYEPALGPIRLDECAPYILGGDESNPGIVNAFSATCHHPLTCLDAPDRKGNPNGISWAIAGGESGSNARPSHPNWFRSVRDQCIDAEVSFFFKQFGEWKNVVIEKDEGFAGGFAFEHPRGGRASVTCAKKFIFSDDSEAYFVKVGKRYAGRLLDGREWKEFPKVEG